MSKRHVSVFIAITILLSICSLLASGIALAEEKQIQMKIEQPKAEEVVNGKLHVIGYAYPVESVEISIDDEYYGRAAYGGSRIDLVDMLATQAGGSSNVPVEDVLFSGFAGVVNTSKLENGPHSIKVVANKGSMVAERTVNVIINNSASVTTEESPESENTEANITLFADFCQCVEYVKRVFGFTGSTANAKDWDTFLQSKGWRKLSRPAFRSIAVFEPSYAGIQGIRSVDKTYGHVAIITSDYGISKGVRTVMIKGANQGGSQTTDRNCYNVSEYITKYNVNPNETSNRITFWAK